VILPTRRLLLLFAGASVLFLWSSLAAVVADLAIVVAVLLDTRLTGDVQVRRETPARMARGATASIGLELRNPTTDELGVEWTDDLPPGLERLGGDESVRTVPAGGRARADYRVRAVGRGDQRLGPVHLRTRGLLGLHVRSRIHPVRDTIRVQPGVLEMRRSRLLGIRHRLRAAGLRNVRQLGEGRAFESLRPYVRGDDPRAIDWKATARRRDVLVRQYEAERSQNVILTLDLGRRMMERVGDAERLDHALTAALMLADVASAHGDRVGILGFADTVQQFLPPRKVPLSRVADSLAQVRPRAIEPNYPLAFAFLARQVRRRSLVVLFTDVVDPEASSAVLSELTRAAERHVVLVVALRNPALADWADAPAPDSAAAYRRAAAEEMIQARALALATARRKGVVIADVSPREAVTEVVNRYLAIKYRGRL
jgi:uncharacterized protein (DUF58 family)